MRDHTLPGPSLRVALGHQRQRRVFLWTLVWFILSQAILVAMVRGQGRFLRDSFRYYQRKYYQAHVAATPAPPLTVVLLGSSHIETGVGAVRLSKQLTETLGRPVVVSNRAVSGGTSFLSRIHLRRLQRDGIRADLVMIEAFPALLSDGIPYTSDMELPLESLDEEDVALLKNWQADRHDLGASRHLERAVPFYSLRSNLLNATVPNLLPSSRRHSPPPQEYPLRALSPEYCESLRIRSWGEYYARLQTLAFNNGRQIAVLRELLRELKAQGIPAVLVAMPEGPLFRSWYPVERWKMSREWLAAFAHDEKTTLHDAREWGNREDLFVDSHHLSIEGSPRFTRWLGTEVLAPPLRDSTGPIPSNKKE